MALSSYSLGLWIEFPIAIAYMLFRFALRFYRPGFRLFDRTDFFCALSTALYIILIVCDYLLQTPAFPSNINLTSETAMAIPDSEVHAYEVGSKLALFNWTIYIIMLYTFKGVPLSIYQKLSIGLPHQRKIVNATIIFTIICGLTCVFIHLFQCLPIERTWQIKPYPGSACTVRLPNYYIIAPLNILTDFIIVILPMPVIFTVQIPLRHKLALALLFGSGSIIILCNILRMIYSLGNTSDMAIAQKWSNIEGFVSMIVVATPGIWPFVKKVPGLSSCLGGNSRYYNSDQVADSSVCHKSHKSIGAGNQSSSGTVHENNHFEMFRGVRRGLSTRRRGTEFDSEAQHIFGRDGDDRPKTGNAPITITTEFSIEHEDNLENDQDIKKTDTMLS